MKTLLAKMYNYNTNYNNNKEKSGNLLKMRGKSGGSSSSICLLLSMTMMLLLVLQQMQPCDCRYLPTRSHGDDLDKLRELMLQILESSNEDNVVPQRLTNEVNGNTVAQRAAWQNKLDGSYDAGIETLPRKYHRRNIYENERY